MLGAILVIRRLYADGQKSRDNERKALLDLLHSKNSEPSDDS